MPWAIDPDPFPLAPDEGHRPRSDLSSAADWCERPLGNRGTAIDKWFRERTLADGRTAIHEHRRRIKRASDLWHTMLHTPRRGVFPVDELD